ncbi:hypothetical protein CR513_46398, partial [Mucuna pruriens]
MRQRKWLEFLKNYNVDLNLHPREVNIVINALSRNSLFVDLRDSSLVCEVTLKSMKLDMLKVTSDLMEVGKINRVITHEKKIGVKIRTDEVMRFYDKIHVLDVTNLRKLILQIGLSSGLSVRPGAARMYKNLREMFRWFDLKEEIIKPMYGEPKFTPKILGELTRALETKVKPDYKLPYAIFGDENSNKRGEL